MAEPALSAPTSVGEEPRPPPGATFAIIVLTAMNLLNYVDRYVPSAVKPLFREELGFTDAQTSWPLTAFVIVYMLASPVFGALADRWPRKVLIAAGVALWSAATGAAAFATGFVSFLLARALVGVGEAAYATIAPSLISDFFAPARRNRILTLFYVAIPVGSALGFAVGSALGQQFGWRTAFLACGLPGLVAAGFVLLMKEPPRGHFDHEAPAPPLSWREALAALAKNREYVWAVGGYTAVTFASGALADWSGDFLVRYHALDVQEAGLVVGGTAVVGGLGGTILGGLLGDWLRGRTRHPYLALSGGSMALAMLFVTLALVVPATKAAMACMLVGQLFLWFYNGPINAVIVNCVGSRLRARAFAFSIFAIHVLGDAISPPIVGELSDFSGNLRAALFLAPAALLGGTLLWLTAWRILPEREEVRG